MKTWNVFSTTTAAAFLFVALTLAGPPLQAETCPSVSLETMDSCPTARFTVLTPDAEVGTPVYFQNQSTGATSYLWDFGDGNTSTAVNASHVYSSAGTYTVKLHAMVDGCTAEIIGIEDVVVG